MTPGQTYTFQLPGPNGTVAQVNVPRDDFKQCPCGCDLFDIRYRVCWAKPTNIIGAQPICFKAEIYVCQSCGAEATADSESIGAARSRVPAPENIVRTA